MAEKYKAFATTCVFAGIMLPVSAALAETETALSASGEPSTAVTWAVTIFSAIGLVFLCKSTYGKKDE